MTRLYPPICKCGCAIGDDDEVIIDGELFCETCATEIALEELAIGLESALVWIDRVQLERKVA